MGFRNEKGLGEWQPARTLLQRQGCGIAPELVMCITCPCAFRHSALWYVLHDHSNKAYCIITLGVVFLTFMERSQSVFPR